MVSDYIIWYGKHRPSTKYRPLYQNKEMGKPGAMSYFGVELSDGSRRSVGKRTRKSWKSSTRIALLFM